MTLDPRTPILVGVGTVTQRDADPTRAKEPLALMAQVLERAADDAGDRALLARADSIRAPRGFWEYPDPCRLLAERFGAVNARTEIAELGILQTTLLGRAAADIAAGRSEIALVVAAEARFRAQRAHRLGVDVPLTHQAPTTPDSVVRPHMLVLSDPEIQAGLAQPAAQYAMLDNARRAADGMTLAEHRRDIATLWAGFSAVAARSPEAWSPEPVSAATIADAAENPFVAFPYGRLHCSQWNVDQAAGFVLCSLATAHTLDIPRDRWVFPLAVTDSNHMVPLTARRDLHRCSGFARAAEQAFARAARAIADVTYFDLYSCFPAAVRVQQREIGIGDERPLTVTGGMTFGGGPLNHYMFQGLASMARVLRADPGSTGLVTAVSGMVTKQGVSLWSTEPGPGFAHDDVSEATARDTPAVPVERATASPATIATYTVLVDRSGPPRTVFLCDLPSGARTLAASSDEAIAECATSEELCGRTVRISADGTIDEL
jgi:acetyl-CoA C-acetyltransferase